MNGGEVYRHVEQLGAKIQNGLEIILGAVGIKAVVAGQGGQRSMNQTRIVVTH